MSDRTIRDWLSRVDKDSKEARDKRIFDLWLACWTLDEIAEDTGVHKDTVSEVCRKTAELPKSDKPAAEHAIDFDIPIYNIWKQQTKSEGSSHFGNSETRKTGTEVPQAYAHHSHGRRHVSRWRWG